MGTLLGRLFGGSSSVTLASGTSLAPSERGHGFGSDFARLSAVPKTAAGAAEGKPWQTYPSRPRSAEDCSGVSFGRWQGDRERDRMAADNLTSRPLIHEQVATPLGRWHTSFQHAVISDVAFEDRRTEAMRQVRYGVPPLEVAFVRSFDNFAVVDQLVEIAQVNDEIERVAASVGKLPKSEVRAMGQRNLDDLVALRDTMLSLTTAQHARKFTELKSELNMLVALNDMACEARSELSRGGADTPLRLKVCGGKLVLKPAASKSRFQKAQIRARNDAARLALLLGESADKPITLSDIHAKGFGKYEYSMVLSDARTATEGRMPSWFGQRALEIDEWKRATRQVETDLRDTDGGKLIGAPPVQHHDDTQFDTVDAVPGMPDGDAITRAANEASPKRADASQSTPAPVVVLGTYDVLPDGTLVPERKPGKSTASASPQSLPTSAWSAAGASAAQRHPASGSPGAINAMNAMIDDFIAAHPVRGRVLSTILERTTSLDSLHDTPPPLPLTPPPDDR